MASRKAVSKQVRHGSKRGKLNINQLAALDRAYDRKLDRSRILKIISGPGIWAFMCGVVTFFDRGITIAGIHIPWVYTGVLVALGLLYGYRMILPKEIKQQYLSDAYAQRNAALNIAAQSFTDKDLPIKQVLDAVLENASGEFQQDIYRLEAIVVNHSSAETVHDAFKAFNQKYGDDVSFVQFFDQVETAVLDGTRDPITFNMITQRHNLEFREHSQFERQRSNARSDLNRIKGFVIGVGFIGMYAGVQMGSFSKFLGYYSYSWMAFVVTVLFTFAFALIQYFFDKRYFDDSVTDM